MTSISLDRPVDVIASLPYLLGYHPGRSVVVLGIARERLVVVQRLDLPTFPPGDPVGAPVGGPGADASTGSAGRDLDPVEVARTLDRARCTSCMVIGLGEAADPVEACVVRLADDLERLGVDMLDALVVAGGRWWSADCADPGCCPPGGSPVPPGHDVPVVAEWVGRGVSPLRDRHSLVALAQPEGAPLRVTALPPPSQQAALAAWAEVLGLGGRRPLSADALDPAVLSAVVATARACPVRDALLDWWCPGLGTPAPDRSTTRHRRPTPLEGDCRRAWGRPPGPTVDGRLDRRAGAGLLLALARRLPPPAAADVLAMAAVLAWYDGEGTLARVCADRVLELVPPHSLGRLVHAMLAVGVRPPRSVPEGASAPPLAG